MKRTLLLFLTLLLVVTAVQPRERYQESPVMQEVHSEVHTTQEAVWQEEEEETLPGYDSSYDNNYTIVYADVPLV